MNISFFLYKELENLMEDFQHGRMKYALHQGLFLLLAKFSTYKQGWVGDLEAFLPILRS